MEKKIIDHDHEKYITSQEFNKLTQYNFTARLVQANLASKNYFANFVKRTNFDDKLQNINKNVTSNKTKHVLIENEANKLPKKVEAVSQKGLTKDLINKYKILNIANYLSLGILQNYLILIPARKYFRFLVVNQKFVLENLMESHKKTIQSITTIGQKFDGHC